MREVKSAKVFGTLLILAFGAAFVAWYVTVSSERERYLTSRNFRLLATIATQLDTSISTQEKTFQTLLAAAPMADAAAHNWVEESGEYVPSLQALDTERVPERFAPKNLTDVRYKRATRVVTEGRDVWFHLAIERETTQREPGRSSPETRNAYLSVAKLLTPMFEPKLRDGAFDTLVLASVNGQVLHAEGARRDELANGRLDAFAAARPLLQVFGDSSADAKSAGFLSIVRTNGTVNVVVSGTEYKLFTQPCCTSTFLEADGNPGLVLVGLIEASAFRSKARQIPTTIVFVFTALILLVLAGWPFLRIRLLGERQRIRRVEVVQVIASGMFAIALLTVCCLDWWAYSHLNTVRDVQLEKLAAKIESHVAAELTDAHRQLKTLSGLAVNCVPPSPSDGSESPGMDVLVLRRIFSRAASKELASCGRPAPDAWPARADPEAIAVQPYPRFKTMALIDKSGKQRIKWASRIWQPAPIVVASRDYFKDAKDGRVWHLDDSQPVTGGSSCDSSGYTLESIWSWTTAEPEAVMAIPTCNGEFPVAAITIPMMSLIDPVVPAGLEFAVIAEDGAVLFHSDPQRNTHENLFEETDQNRRLRAAAAAHVAEHIDLRYAGRSYRSYVQRLGAGTPWAIVTLSNNEATWGLHTEWLVLSLVALLMFLLGLAVLFALCFFTGHANWLWADSRQVARYRGLSLLTTALLVVAFLILVFGANRTVVIWSVTLPLVAWVICFVVVRRPAPGEMPMLDAHPEWASLAVLLFLLTGIVPAAGFLTAVYRLDVRADLKHVQLQFARSLAEHERWLNQTRYPEEVPAWSSLKEFPERYDLYNTPAATANIKAPRPDDLPSVGFVQSPRAPVGEQRPGIIDAIAEIVAEEYLPYYSERAVQIRELLLHQRAEDNAWWWSNDTLTFTRPRGQTAIVVAAAAPRLAAGLLDVSPVLPGALVVLSAMGLITLAWSVVWFIEVHVCLRGVEEPLWAKAKWTGSSGQNLYVICDAAERAKVAEGCFDLRTESTGWTMTDDALMARLIERDRTAPGYPVLCADLDEDLGNAVLARRKLAWVEQLAADDTRTVIVLSSDRPNTVDQALRAQFRAKADAQLIQRWRALLGSFAVIDWRKSKESHGAEGASWIWSVPKQLPRTVEGIRGLLDVRTDHVALDALEAEATADAFVSAVCDSIESRLPLRRSERKKATTGVQPAAGTATKGSNVVAEPPTAAAPNDAALASTPGAAEPPSIVRLSSEQVLDEIADRTDAWYRRIWRSCSPDEQLVLAEIASEGFVNYKSRRTVRRLLGRRLIAKDPSFRLMNETFRRFVLAPPSQADIRLIEGASESSAWDRLRGPLFTVVVSASLFFLVTQRELFNATIATLSTLTAAVPVMARVVSLVTGKRADSEQKP